jgi:hypothetical protein
MFSNLKYIKRFIVCNFFIFQRRHEIITKKLLDNSKPFMADFVVDTIDNEKDNHGSLHHYFVFILDHIEVYLFTVLFTFLIEFIYESNRKS